MSCRDTWKYYSGVSEVWERLHSNGGRGTEGRTGCVGRPAVAASAGESAGAGADSPRWQALGYLMYDTDFVHKDQTVIRSCGESRERRGQQPERLSPSVTGS